MPLSSSVSKNKPINKPAELLATRSMLGLFFEIEDGDMFLRNVG
jgi:hypothetical protein